MGAAVGTQDLSKRRLSSRCRFRKLLLTSVAVVATGTAAQADDVNITSDVNNGVLLDGFSGTTALVQSGVTVSSTTFNFNCPVPPAGTSVAGVCASTRAWTLTNEGTIGPTPFGDGVHFSAGGSVINKGAIDSVNGNNGVWIEGGTSGSVDNQLGATINARFGAIVIGTFAAPITGTVTNAGTITSNNQAIGLSGGGAVTNLATGRIIGHGGNNAVSAVLGTTTVINSGYIQSNDSGFGTGVAIAGGTVTNNAGGQILGAYNAIWANGSIATAVINHGYLEASIAQGGGAGIEFDAGGSLVNTGIIRSFTSNSTSSDYGVYFTGAGSITNRGTIESLSGGLAIRFGGAATHTLNLDTGSVLGGNVQGGTGTDNLVLMGTGSETIGKFLNFETLSMQGTDWALTGTGAFTTGATVDSGLLRVNGTLTSPTVTVQPGGTLGGGGTVVGAVTVNGNIAPGNSIGTLNITGAYTQASGSTYTVEVNASPASDLINVTGAAAIQSNATVSVLAAPGLYTVGTRYTILTATGGVTGTYDTLVDNAPFIDFLLAYDLNDVYLDVTFSTVSFVQVAQTPNQRAAAGGIESLGVGNPVFDAVLGLDTANALRAFDLLSGEIHASVKGVLVEDSRYARDAVLSRLRQLDPGAGPAFASSIASVELASGDGGSALAYSAQPRERGHPLAAAPAMRTGPVLTAWSQAFGGTGRTDGDGNAASVSRNTGGFIAGLDMTTSNAGAWRFGMAAGYQHSALSVDDRSSSGGIDSHQLAAYAGTQQGPVGLRFGGAYAWNDISTTRNIAFPGLGETVRSDYRGSTAQVFGEAAYRLSLRDVALEPYAGLAHAVGEVDSMLETGGSTALTGDRSRFDATFSTLGLRASVPLPIAGSDVTARGALGWRHAFDTTPVSTLTFASGGSPFTVAGAPLGRDALTAEAGLDAKLTDRLSAGVSYSGQYAGNAYDHAVKGQIAYRF